MLSYGKLEAEKLISHEFSLNEILKSYDTFSNAKDEKALKIVLNKLLV